MGNLFAGRDMPDEARHRTDEALRRVATADIEELLSRDLEVLLDEYVIPFVPATVRWDDVEMTEPSHTSSTGPSRVGYHGARSNVTVPVDGDSLMLTYRSHQGAPYMSNIDGTVRRGVLEFEWSGQLEAGAAEIQRWFTQRREFVEQFLVNNNRDTAPLNEQMRSSIRSAIEQRRKRELERRKLAASLPFPIKRKEGATTPVRVRRTPVKVQPRPTSAPFKPEPELDQETYEAILRDCVAMATIFERMPLGDDTHEEHLRNMILAMLNTNYTGQVAGEVFNGSGKTDILMRYEDRNVFIGECKFYKGPKSVGDAVDQLLGYMVWRDTKAALIVFVADGNFSEIVRKINEAIEVHAQRQKTRAAADPARRSDYIFTRFDDPDRAIRLAVLPFKLHS